MIKQHIKRKLYKPIITKLTRIVNYYNDHIKFLNDQYNENIYGYGAETLMNLYCEIRYEMARKESFEEVLQIIDDYTLR